MTAEWVLVVDMCGKPTLTNQAHQMHYRAVSADRKVWRQAGAVLARAAHIPPMDRITVDVTARWQKGTLPDPDAVAPALKGVLDGIVDAGVVPDDSGRHVEWVRYFAPVLDRALPPALLVTIAEFS